MKTYVQFKDDVVFACVTTDGEINAENMVEVECDGHSHLNQKLIDGQWVDAPIIRYAILDNTNTVIQVEKTYFLSVVKDNPIIDNDLVNINWQWNGVEFTEPKPWFVAEEYTDAEEVLPTQIIEN